MTADPSACMLSNARCSAVVGVGGHVVAYGGAAEFVKAWLDHEATRTGWTGAQLSLF